jgi:vacuolar-type H+-ATPase subunit I/STV1
MDPISVKMVRAALIWLAIGFIFGALMLSDASIPGSWRAWFAPTHGHVLFVGWFLQFAVGIAYWLLPRQRTDERPLGYQETAALLAFLILNVALVLRVVAEPAPRIGYLEMLYNEALVVSAVLHVVAIGIVVTQLWGRIIPRPVRRNRNKSESTSSSS